MSEKPLTQKMRAFVEAYDGSVENAAKKAGITYQYARKLSTKVNIIAAIRNKQSTQLMPLIATREERQQFWSETMKNPEIDMKDRLKASELLGKSNADFTEKILVGDLESELKGLPDEDMEKRIEHLRDEVMH